MSDTKLTPMESFQEKVKNKLVSDIGELLPDEALKEMVDKAMQEAFFKPQMVIEGTGYHQKQFSKPSVFEETVKQLIEPLFREEIKLWISENNDVVVEKIHSFLNANVETAMIGAIQSMLSGHFDLLKWNVANELQMRLGG